MIYETNMPQVNGLGRHGRVYSPQQAARTAPQVLILMAEHNFAMDVHNATTGEKMLVHREVKHACMGQACRLGNDGVQI